jgi:hypothetical protein
MKRSSFSALGLALVLHAPLLVGFLLAPGLLPPSGKGQAPTSGPACSLRLEAVPSAPVFAPRVDSPRDEGELLPVHYQPRLRKAPVLQPVPEVPPLSPLPGPGPTAGPSAGGASSGVRGLARVAPRVKRVVFVLDRSVSMALHGYLDSARAEIADALRRLSPETQFQVVLYQRHASVLLGPLPSRLHPAEPATVERAVRALETVTAEGPTVHRAGMELALSLAPEAVVLLTDEDDLTADDERALVRLNRGAALHVIELRRGPLREGAFTRLARATGGSHRRIASSGE